MTELQKQLTMPWLTTSQKIKVWYCLLSLTAVCIMGESDVLVLALLVLNFAISAILVRNVPMPETD